MEYMCDHPTRSGGCCDIRSFLKWQFVSLCRIGFPWWLQTLLSKTTLPPQDEGIFGLFGHVRPKLYHGLRQSHSAFLPSRRYFLFIIQAWLQGAGLDGAGLSVLFIFILWHRLASKTQNALCILCNSLIHAGVYFFARYISEHTYANFITLDLNGFLLDMSGVLDQTEESEASF